MKRCKAGRHKEPAPDFLVRNPKRQVTAGKFPIPVPSDPPRADEIDQDAPVSARASMAMAKTKRAPTRFHASPTAVL